MLGLSTVAAGGGGVGGQSGDQFSSIFYYSINFECNAIRAIYNHFESLSFFNNTFKV